MSLIVPITNVPNQTLNVVLSNQNCTINLTSRNGNVYFDLFINTTKNIIYSRKLSLTPVLPYKYMQGNFTGNFILTNNDGNLITNPNYQLFGVSQTLLYYTKSDL